MMMLLILTSNPLLYYYRHKLSGMNMSLSDYDKRTALHLAAAEGHLHCVSFLVEKCNLPLEPSDRRV